MSDLKKKASDPATPAVELQQLATNPELRPLIAKNPAAYTGLLDWMAAKNEPPVTAALREREEMFRSGVVMEMPSVSLHEVPSPAAPHAPDEPLESGDSAGSTVLEADSPQDANPDSPAESATPEDTTAPEAATHETAGSEAPSFYDSVAPHEPAAAGNTAPNPAPEVPPEPAAPQRTSILGGFAPSGAAPGSGDTTVLPPFATPAPGTPAPDIPGADVPADYPAYAAAGGYAPGTPVTPGAPAAPGTPAPSYPGFYAPPAVTGSIPVMVAPGETQQGKSNAVLWVIFGVLLAAVVGLAVALVWTFLGGNDNPPTAAPTAQTTPSESETGGETDPKAGGDKATETPEESAESTEKPIQAPAPSDALKGSAMTTKSGNTTCAVSGETLTCAVKDHEATIGSCDPSTAAVVTLGDDASTVSCIPKESYSTQGTVPNYGQSVDMGGFACTSLYDYTECWNVYTGRGFQIARQLYNQITID